MVVIRLSRRGRKGIPHFAIVVADQRQKNTGRFIERIGYINKARKDECALDADAYTAWINKGAQPTESVKKIFEDLNAAE